MGSVLKTPRAVVIIDGYTVSDEDMEYIMDRHAFLNPAYFAGMIVPEPRDPFALAGWGVAHSEETALSMEYSAALIGADGEPEILVTIIAHGCFWPLLQAVYEAITGATVRELS